MYAGSMPPGDAWVQLRTGTIRERLSGGSGSGNCCFSSQSTPGGAGESHFLNVLWVHKEAAIKERFGFKDTSPQRGYSQTTVVPLTRWNW